MYPTYCKVNLQVHDNLIFSVSPTLHAWECTKFLVESLNTPLVIGGKKLHIPCEVKVLWNWAEGVSMKRLPECSEFMDVVKEVYAKVKERADA